METCRFCLEDATLTTLVEPCQCRGSVRYVHPECLDRELMIRAQNGQSSKHCRICGGPYALRPSGFLLVLSLILLPLAVVYIAMNIKNSVILTILFIVSGMNWSLCVFWTLTPLALVLKSRTVRCLLALGLLVPFARHIPTVSILLSFMVPYVTFLLWVSEETSPRRIVYGCFGLAEFCLLLASIVTQVPFADAAMLLSVLSVLPISVLMVTV